MHCRARRSRADRGARGHPAARAAAALARAPASAPRLARAQVGQGGGGFKVTPAVPGNPTHAPQCSALQPSDMRSQAARGRHLRLALGGQQARERAEAAGAARGAVGVRRGRAGRRHRRRHLLLQQRERARGVRLVVVVLRRAVCARGAGLELGAVGGAAHSAQGFEPWARASRGPPQRLHAGLQPACCTLAPAMPAPTHTGHARGLGPRPGPRTSAAGARALGRRRLHRVQRVAQALRGPGCMGRPVQPCPALRRRRASQPLSRSLNPILPRQTQHPVAGSAPGQHRRTPLPLRYPTPAPDAGRRGPQQRSPREAARARACAAIASGVRARFSAAAAPPAAPAPDRSMRPTPVARSPSARAHAAASAAAARHPEALGAVRTPRAGRAGS